MHERGGMAENTAFCCWIAKNGGTEIPVCEYQLIYLNIECKHALSFGCCQFWGDCGEMLSMADVIEIIRNGAFSHAA
jgi:hypothetical protein